MKKRVEEMKEDKLDLYNRAYDFKHELGPLKNKGSWLGHMQAATDLKKGLKENIIDYEYGGCNVTYKKLPSVFKRISNLKIPQRP